MGAGAITFENNSARIRPGAQGQLATLAAQMQANPTCQVVIIGAGNESKLQQQRSWDRVNAVIEYMSEKHGIDRNRFIFQYGQAGDANSVMYRSAMPGETGPANVAPPFPNLRRD
jgi:outer membrane protein OmpA-like peptidoglycan-associated protein